MGKNVVLFLDGTWNKPTHGAEDSNVRKLFDSCSTESDRPPWPQRTYYLPGVGTNIKQSGGGDKSESPQAAKDLQRHGTGDIHWLGPNFEKLVYGATGGGTGERIREAYAFLSHSYEQGDKVFLFGFSRGAYAVRSLINFVETIGLLLKDKLEFVVEAYKLFEKGADVVSVRNFEKYLVKLVGPNATRRLNDNQIIQLHFIGLWDTVGAMGNPWAKKSDVARRTEAIAAYLPGRGVAIRHALALHDLRSIFAPLVWSNVPVDQDIKQVWFAGAHSDIGGGYPFGEDGLASEALLWMAGEAEVHGLTLRGGNTSLRRAGKRAEAMTGNVDPARVFHTGLEALPFRWAPPTARGAIGQILAAWQLGSAALRLHSSVSIHLNAPRAFRYGPTTLKKEVLTALHSIDEAIEYATTLGMVLGWGWETTTPIESPMEPILEPVWPATIPWNSPSTRWTELLANLNAAIDTLEKHGSANSAGKAAMQHALSACNVELKRMALKAGSAPLSNEQHEDFIWLHFHMFQTLARCGRNSDVCTDETAETFSDLNDLTRIFLNSEGYENVEVIHQPWCEVIYFLKHAVDRKIGTEKQRSDAANDAISRALGSLRMLEELDVGSFSAAQLEATRKYSGNALDYSLQLLPPSARGDFIAIYLSALRKAFPKGFKLKASVD